MILEIFINKLFITLGVTGSGCLCEDLTSADANTHFCTGNLNFKFRLVMQTFNYNQLCSVIYILGHVLSSNTCIVGITTFEKSKALLESVNSFLPEKWGKQYLYSILSTSICIIRIKMKESKYNVSTAILCILTYIHCTSV